MKFGLLGKNLAHSFSKSYFNKKFEAEKLGTYQYLNFEIKSLAELPGLLDKHPDLKGFNVTIPYKKAIVPYLDHLSAEAKIIGAVNTVKLVDGKLTGHNTDWWGFMQSLEPMLYTHHQRSLILGSGGASAAVAYGLSQLGMTYFTVSRTPQKGQLDYTEAAEILKQHLVVINCTPAGTWPQFDEMPPLDLYHLGEKHLVYDLIYNPPESKLLRLAKEKGASVMNGFNMLELQAEKAWAIWNEL